MKIRPIVGLVSILLSLNMTQAIADEMEKMDHGNMQGEENTASSAENDFQMDNDARIRSMQGGKAPLNARDPHAFSDGYDFGEIPRPVLADEHNFGSLLVSRLEQVKSDKNTSTTYDLQAWYGRDYDRLVLKAEGDIDSSNLQEARTELLWGHAIATFWDAQLGVRYDYGREDVDRTWLAFGVQGLAPYWFELDVAAYVGKSGRTALRFESEYELLLTQKLILQPRFEMNLYGKSDPKRGLGSGLSDLSAGIRLRYEIAREFAPYIGVEWAAQFGNTKDLTKASGGDPNEARLVAGVRFWF
ncbi:MAG: copper resistance protein B [Methylophaga sp.]|nr:copper resistance protein B [Methylophaga sp.]